MKKFLLVYLIIISKLAYSSCNSDIYSIGLSLDSIAYDLERNGGKAEIASSQGMGFLLGNIILCPKDRYELNPYLRLRSYELDKSDNALDTVDDKVNLPSLGSKFRYFYSNDIEIVGDVEVRDEFAVTSDDQSNRVYNNTYLNLKTLIGARYFMKSNKFEDYTIAFKYGLLLPIDSNADIGRNLELDLEYFNRLTKKYSIRADVFYSLLYQDVEDLTISRQEVGLRYNYVFRY